MPGIPLVARESNHSRGADQMCRQDSRLHLSAEEEIVAEESLSLYCKPIEFYNILKHRATARPLFLQRCLAYKIQAKNSRRMEMTVSLTGNANDGLETQSLFPMYILLARQLPNTAVAQHQEAYDFSKVGVLASYVGVEGINQSQVKFILPEMTKLSVKVKDNFFTVLFVSCAKLEGGGLVGKIPLEPLCMSWEKSLNLGLGERAEMLTTVDMHPCVVKPSSFENMKCISFEIPCNNGGLSMPLQVPVSISAEEVGAKDRTPYNLYSYSGIPTSSLSDVVRLRSGNVLFHYRYYNNRLERLEVTEDFSCPFCLVKCASYKGLRHHLLSSHDLFNFEFSVTEEYQAVIVCVNIDQWSHEIVADGVDPKRQTFDFCSKSFKRRKPKSVTKNTKHCRPLVLDSDLPASLDENRIKVNGGFECLEHNTSSLNATGCSSATAQSCVDPEYAQSVPENNLAPPAMLQFAKTRKLSAERSDPRNRTLLQKRQFFHSHRAQPMALEQILSDRDSEDEVDDDVADLEDRRMLDDFVDVTKDEKQMMHLWNSFVRKQRVLADGHIPWACEAFSKLHEQDFALAPTLLWCWRLFMVKMWNHGLLDARSMNNCNRILDQFQSQDMDPMRS